MKAKDISNRARQEIKATEALRIVSIIHLISRLDIC